ncbi:hypothetical protein [Dolichospermum circinale]|nr:hypothetical protein [Dolichospermum circinale]MDB9465277.1 hypothetical protein [Dolichospermum circinale CS-539/09]MDB9470279.1 hypothetical protein [Dolichospermum circinale CS-539]
MKTDKLFYRIFLNQPDLIAELIPGIPSDCELRRSKSNYSFAKTPLW